MSESVHHSQLRKDNKNLLLTRVQFVFALYHGLWLISDTKDQTQAWLCYIAWGCSKTSQALQGRCNLAGETGNQTGWRFFLQKEKYIGPFAVWHSSTGRLICVFALNGTEVLDDKFPIRDTSCHSWSWRRQWIIPSQSGRRRQVRLQFTAHQRAWASSCDLFHYSLSNVIAADEKWTSFLHYLRYSHKRSISAFSIPSAIIWV